MFELRKTGKASMRETGINHEGSLGSLGTIFSILSTIIGGGMVSIPWAFYNCGIPVALALSLYSSAQVVVSCYLFLKTRKICPESTSSMFEMGFLIIGRPAIFWIAFVILINSFALPIIYFSVFGEILKSIETSMISN